MKKTVQVLMSTYNGEKYIKEQIDSILNQKEVEVRLLIRDDGSKDATMNILKEYETQYRNVKVYTGKNLGACNSFFDLMKNADKGVSYYAFADQDDVWKENKLNRALSKLQEYDNVPALYCGSYELVNSSLEPIGNHANHQKHSSFGNSLIECIYSGCTGVFNKKLLELTLRQLPEHAYMHDWWVYMIAASMGQVICDEEPGMLYRQHENNVLGGNSGKLKHLVRRIKNFKNLCNYVPQQIEEFDSIYHEDLTEEQRKLIECMVNKNKNPFKRLEIFKRKEIKRNSSLDNLVYKGMFLFWRL